MQGDGRRSRSRPSAAVPGRPAGLGYRQGVPKESDDVEPDAAPPARQLLLTIFARYARGERDWLSVSSLLALMAPLGVDGPAVRSSISRLKRTDVLVGVRRHGLAGYALSPSILPVLVEGDERIFGRRRSGAEDGWVLVSFSVPESERVRRHELRSTLRGLGFGTASPGLWIAPGGIAPETVATLERRGLASYVDVFRAEFLGLGEVGDRVARWWDLPALAAVNQRFLDDFQPFARRYRRGNPSPERAFADYVQVLTRWRRLPYADPGLSIAALPVGWNGLTADALFRELEGLLAAAAAAHVADVTAH